MAGRGYIFVEMTIKDPEGFKRYTALSAPAVHAAGGRYIVRGVAPEMLEGSPSADRIVVVEFDTVAQAHEFYHSAAYQAARAKRLSAAEFRMTLLDGASDPARARRGPPAPTSSAWVGATWRKPGSPDHRPGGDASAPRSVVTGTNRTQRTHGPAA